MIGKMLVFMHVWLFHKHCIIIANSTNAVLHGTSPFEFKLKRDKHKLNTEQGVNPIDLIDVIRLSSEHWFFFLVFLSILTVVEYMN